MSQTEAIKPKGPKNPKLMLVKYGRIGLMSWFEHHENHIPRLNKYVVVKTERGMELGEIVGLQCYRGGQFKSTPEQVDAYFNCKEMPIGHGGSFVRFATHEDLHEQQHLEKSAVEEARTCQKLATELGLDMIIVEAEHLFGGERIVFYFTSEGRVDFRELVKRLAKEYQTRIELRQIGSRDEAKLISDYETCGQQCCCSRYLKILEPVNMRMAKLQKATLDPSKISGHCGRLKCCLRYEDATYLDLRKRLPQRSDFVQTPKGQGKVVDLQILTQLVIVQDALGDRQAWPVDEIRVLNADEVRDFTKAAGEGATPPVAEQTGRRIPRQEKVWQKNRPRPQEEARPSEKEEVFDDVQEVEPVSPEIDAPETSIEESQAEQNNNADNNNNGPKKNRNRRRRRNRNRNRQNPNGQNNNQGGQNRPGPQQSSGQNQSQ